MQPPTTSSFKLAFLRHMKAGLRRGGVSSTAAPGMSIAERKRAIKSAADVAMALASGGRSRWSRALVADQLAGQEKNRGGGALAGYSILGRRERLFERLGRPAPQYYCGAAFFSGAGGKKLLRRSSSSSRVMRSKIRKGARPAPRRAASASLLAKRMVRKRTQVLRRLVPGGETMEDDASLLEETLDYVVFLRAQVDLMQRLTSALEPSKCSGSGAEERDLPEKRLRRRGKGSPGEGETLIRDIMP